MRPLFANLALAAATTLTTSVVVFHPRAAVAVDCPPDETDCVVVTVDKQVTGGPLPGTKLKITLKEIRFKAEHEIENRSKLQDLARNPWWQNKDYAQLISGLLLTTRLDWPVIYNGRSETLPHQVGEGSNPFVRTNESCVYLSGFQSSQFFDDFFACSSMSTSVGVAFSP